MVRWDEYYYRIRGFWREYRKSKMGIAGLSIILFFVGMAITAPLFAPWPAPVIVGQAPRLAAPMWLLPLDPGGFTTVYPIENPAFDTNADGWVYNESLAGEGVYVVNNSHFDVNDAEWSYYSLGPGASMFHNPTEGYPEGSGPGSFEIQYNDSSTLAPAPGLTDAILDYDYNFNADKYPPGIMTTYPSRVTVIYAIQFIIDNTVGELGDAEAEFIIEMSNSSGVFVEIFSRLYRSTGALAWSTRSRDMAPADVAATFSVTDLMTLRFRLRFNNFIPQDIPQMICRLDDLQVRLEASYADPLNNPLITGQHSPTVGSNASGPGSYSFTYNDNNNLSSYISPTAMIQFPLEWNTLNIPQEVYFRYHWKLESSAPLGDASVLIFQECYVEATGFTQEIYRSDPITQDRDWARSPEKVWDPFMIDNTFADRGTLWIRFRILILDPTPQNTPTFNIYVDDCILDVKGNYFGSLGAGQFGEDLWAQLLWGSRIALAVGLTAAFIATAVGLVVGLISGYFGGLVDEILMRVTDFFLIIPGLPLMIILAAILGPGWQNIVLVIALVGWTGTARLVRSQVLAERQKAYVEAARAIGASDIYIIGRHILPNVTPLLFAQITLGVAGSILSEAGLSFLSLTHPLDVSWGRMLLAASQAGAYNAGAWWYLFFPGLCIVLLAMSFTLVGYAVDEILNPRLRIRKE
ncbi:MAG: ABC transporter permease subunit [Promethearchaeota archaeon]